MIDTGVSKGVKALWEEGNLLKDYTIKVDGQSFHVHRIIIASVSRFFEAMLSQGYRESDDNSIELKGLDPGTVGELLDFVYTGDPGVIHKDNVVEMLKTATYLQMKVICKYCEVKMVETLDCENCLRVLSFCIEYALKEECRAAMDFLNTNSETVVDKCNPDDLSEEAVKEVIRLWVGSEWFLFVLVKGWLQMNLEERKAMVNDLMCQIRFGLMENKCLKKIPEMAFHKNCEGSWQGLVQAALDYLDLPIHLKVIETSEQFRSRSLPRPSMFVKNFDDETINFYTLTKNDIWHKHPVPHNTPDIFEKGQWEIFLKINNFLLVVMNYLVVDDVLINYFEYNIDENYCVVDDGRQEFQVWHIFDPYSKSWSKMEPSHVKKSGFGLAFHNDILYVLGGQVEKNSTNPTDIELYNFKTNTWSTSLDQKLPVYITDPLVFVIGDVIYMYGWNWYVPGGSGHRVYSLNLASPDKQWQRGADQYIELAHLHVGVVRVLGEDVFVVGDASFHLYYYTPSKDQWTRLENDIILRPRESKSVHISQCYTLNNNIECMWVLDGDEEKSRDEDRKCWRFTISESGDELGGLVEYAMPRGKWENTEMLCFGGLLSIKM